MNDATGTIGRSICPCDPKFPPSNPDFDSDSDTNAGAIVEVTVTVPLKLLRTFMVDSHFKDYVGIRVPIWEVSEPRRREVWECSRTNAVGSVRTLDGTCI